MSEKERSPGEDVALAPVARRWEFGRHWKKLDAKLRSRILGFAGFLALLAVAFFQVLWDLVSLARGVDLHSHILLVPFVTIYLLWIRRHTLPSQIECSPFWATLIFVLAAIPWVSAGIWWLNDPDYLSAMTLSFVGLVIGGAFLFFGSQWARAAAFPLFFLIFMVPLPAEAIDALEHASKLGSSEAADLLFGLAGMTYMRDGTHFYLPGVTLEVAQQCSGIRSSLVLFITGVFAANLLLQTTWRRCLLAFVVIPLGLLRNGFRIVTLGYLSVHVGRHILDSDFHHKGGPIFFALSMIPLLALVWWLRKGEARNISVSAPFVEGNSQLK